MLGWVAAGAGRSCDLEQEPGDLLIICGAIGDGWLGLKAAQRRASQLTLVISRESLSPTSFPLLCSARRLCVPMFAPAPTFPDGLIADAFHIC